MPGGDSTYKVPSNGFHAPLDPKGFFGGVHAGYNYEFPSRFVLGVEGDVNFADIKSSNITGFTGAGAPVPIESFSSKLDWFGSARLRVGYAVDRLLPYVTGGVAVGDYFLIANICHAEVDMAGLIVKKQQAGATEAEVLASFHSPRDHSQAVIRRPIAAAHVRPRTDDPTAVDRFVKDQTAQCCVTQ